MVLLTNMCMYQWWAQIQIPICKSSIQYWKTLERQSIWGHWVENVISHEARRGSFGVNISIPSASVMNIKIKILFYFKFQKRVVALYSYNTSEWMQQPEYRDTGNLSLLDTMKDPACDVDDHVDSGIGSDESSLELSHSSTQVADQTPGKLVNTKG